MPKLTLAKVALPTVFRRVVRLTLKLVMAGALLAVGNVQAQTWPAISLSSPISGFSFPVHVTHAGDDSGRVFVVELAGRIRVVKNGVALAVPFLDIVARTGCSQGLLSVAFPPNFSTSGRFYVNYVEKDTCNLVISRFTLSGNPDVADAASEQKVLTVPHEYTDYQGTAIFHSGGELAFGPDGFLYLGIGDNDTGADPGDARGLAQNLSTLRGKVVRLDVETGGPATYVVPTTNPYRNTANARPEIWAVGVRNPWRSSFDSATGDYYLADVGQNAYEEINFQSAGSGAGANYGWPIMEGPNCHSPAKRCVTTGLTLPVGGYVSNRATSNSITGGRVYRGTMYPRMQGIYFYGDFGSGNIWGTKRVNGVWQSALLRDNLAFDAPTPRITGDGLVSFGSDEAGNLYVTDSRLGLVYSIVDSGTLLMPAANPDSATTNKNKTVTIDVLANDSAVGGALSVTSVFEAVNGVATITKDRRNIQFTPARNFIGAARFDYSISNEHGTASAGVSVTVTER